jgi:hypothetical protein
MVFIPESEVFFESQKDRQYKNMANKSLVRTSLGAIISALEGWPDAVPLVASIVLSLNNTPTVITPTLITPTLNTSTVTDSLCNSGTFSNPNAVRDCPFNLKGAGCQQRAGHFCMIKRALRELYQCHHSHLKSKKKISWPTFDYLLWRRSGRFCQSGSHAQIPYLQQCKVYLYIYIYFFLYIYTKSTLFTI